MAYLENDFISPIIYTWPGLLKYDFISTNYLYMTMAYLENDFISPIIYTWPWLT